MSDKSTVIQREFILKVRIDYYVSNTEKLHNGKYVGRIKNKCALSIERISDVKGDFSKPSYGRNREVFFLEIKLLTTAFEDIVFGDRITIDSGLNIVLEVLEITYPLANNLEKQENKNTMKRVILPKQTPEEVTVDDLMLNLDGHTVGYVTDNYIAVLKRCIIEEEGSGYGFWYLNDNLSTRKPKFFAVDVNESVRLALKDEQRELYILNCKTPMEFVQSLVDLVNKKLK